MLMGAIWCGMVGMGLLLALVQGRLGGLTAALMTGASNAVTLCLSLAGPLCLWSGVLRVMERCGLTARLGRAMRPLLRRLFPESSRDAQTLGCITANFTANLLGLGNAATPMGIAAVQRMRALHGGAEATQEMCRLIVLNTASVQLLPGTVAAVRASLGSAAPLSILPAVWLTSAASVAVGLAGAKLLWRHD